jgi:hypothetical protein
MGVHNSAGLVDHDHFLDAGRVLGDLRPDVRDVAASVLRVHDESVGLPLGQLALERSPHVDHGGVRVRREAVKVLAFDLVVRLLAVRLGYGFRSTS